MNNSINLLDYKNKIQPKHDNGKYKSLRLIAVGLLFTVSVASVIFFLLVALSPIPQLRKKEEIASLNLASSREEIIKLALLKKRTDSISELIDKRSAFDLELSEIQTKLPAGVKIQSEELSKNNLTITFFSDSLLKFEAFLNELISKNQTEKSYSRISIADLSADYPKNGFLLTVSLDTL